MALHNAGMLEQAARGSLAGATGGFIAWSVYFLASYAFLSIGCAAGFADAHWLGIDAIRLTLLLLTAGTLLLIGYFGWRSLHAARAARGERTPAPFLAALAAALAGLALLSTAWVGLPVFLLRPCA